MKNVMQLLFFGFVMLIGMVSAGKQNHEYFRRAKPIEQQQQIKRDTLDEDCGKGAFGGVFSGITP